MAAVFPLWNLVCLRFQGAAALLTICLCPAWCFSLPVSTLWSPLSLFFPSRCKFFSLTETPEDYTIIVDEEGFKGKLRFVDPPSRCGNGWWGGGWRSRCVIFDSSSAVFEHTLSLWTRGRVVWLADGVNPCHYTPSVVTGHVLHKCCRCCVLVTECALYHLPF